MELEKLIFCSSFNGPERNKEVKSIWFEDRENS